MEDPTKFTTVNQQEGGNKYRKLRMKFFPDIVKLVNSEFCPEAEHITKMINLAMKVSGNGGWGGTFSQKDPVLFFRQDGDNYVRAEREILTGSPDEFLDNLQIFVDTGKLPSKEWETEVEARIEQEPQYAGTGYYGDEDDSEEDRINREAFEAAVKREEEFRVKCEARKTELEQEFNFIKIDLGIRSLDQERILFFMDDLAKCLRKVNASLIPQIAGTEIVFVKRWSLFDSPIQEPVEININIPGYFEVIRFTHVIEDAVINLRNIRARNSEKVNDPKSLPTEKPFFWLQDLSENIKSKFGINVEIGKYDELGESKVRQLQQVFDELEKLDKKYSVELKGSTISFKGKSMFTVGEDEAEMHIRYVWGGVADNSALSLAGRVKDVVDGGHLRPKSGRGW